MPTSPRDESLQAYCDQLWQTHERHGRVGAPFYEVDFEILQDPEHLYALLLIENQIAGNSKGAEHLEPRLFALVDGGPEEAAMDGEKRWRTVYELELEEFWSLNRAMTDSYNSGVGWAARQAELTAGEEQVLRLWLAGDDVEGIAGVVGRQRRTVQVLLERARSKLITLPCDIRTGASGAGHSG